MAYDPSITQKVWKAVKSATDQFLAVDVLLQHNEKQDRKIGALEDSVKALEWIKSRAVIKETIQKMIDISINDALRKTRLKITYMKWVLISVLLPASVAITGVIAEHFIKRIGNIK